MTCPAGDSSEDLAQAFDVVEAVQRTLRKLLTLYKLFSSDVVQTKFELVVMLVS